MKNNQPKSKKAGTAVAKGTASKPPAAEQQAESPRMGVARYRVRGPDLPADVKSSGIMAASPVFNSAGVMHPLQKNLAGEKATTDSLMLAIDAQVELVQAGDLREVEAMLLAQAIGLQTQWANLSRRASVQEYLPQFQAYMTLGLKAQAQSRATLQALIELKQPRHAPTFIKQANVAHGHQQVNNSPTPSEPPSHAEEKPSPRIKLLETDTTPNYEYLNKGVNDERLDQRAPRAAG